MPRRISDILNELEKQNLDGLLIFSDANIAYLTNYLSRESILLVSPSGNVFITDSRYTQEARHYLKNLASVVTINGSLSETIALTLRNHKLKTVGFEAAFLSYARFINLRKNTKAQKISLRPVIGLIEKYRQIKNPEEIKAIRKSCHISLKTLAFIKNKIRPGKTELEIAAEIERFIRCNGARMSSFEIIVASGPHSA
ncbi:MAG: aminopeptidase P family protein, partial [Candidatus Omnitrophica bacterium]|nr:aminopeptidase P family protein [Candidatus Omnitrophota bacterium]